MTARALDTRPGDDRRARLQRRADRRLVRWAHIYADNGVYTVTIKVTDDDGGSATKTFNVTVNNVAPTLTVVPNQTVNEGAQLSINNIGQFTDPGFDNPLNPNGPSVETFTYTINWGDGTSINSGPATIDVHGSNNVLTAGSFDGAAHLRRQRRVHRHGQGHRRRWRLGDQNL